MSEKGLTNISLKKINKSKVYQYIYRKKTTSKLQIVQELQMGLSTVSQNLDRKSTRLNSSHSGQSRMPSSA